ncbi:hypothetical protein ACD578_28375 (plasmid) [Microvirga sp. RSM25]|uniref:hypothetical protein n=1 Tax=Microvirga sp. RSM25 TaxID=3273802 RepID=UPI00384C80C2
MTGTQYGMPLHEGVDAAAQSKTLHPKEASWATVGEAAEANNINAICAGFLIKTFTLRYELC